MCVIMSGHGLFTGIQLRRLIHQAAVPGGVGEAKGGDAAWGLTLTFVVRMCERVFVGLGALVGTGLWGVFKLAWLHRDRYAVCNDYS